MDYISVAGKLQGKLRRCYMEKSRKLSNINGVTSKVHRSSSWRSSYHPKQGRFENWKSSDCCWIEHNESLKIQNEIWKVKWGKKVLLPNEAATNWRERIKHVSYLFSRNHISLKLNCPSNEKIFFYTKDSLLINV